MVWDNQQQGQVERGGVELSEGGLLNGLPFECVVLIWEICNGDPIFYVILDL
jgi:hypothetical protein